MLYTSLSSKADNDSLIKKVLEYVDKNGNLDDKSFLNEVTEVKYVKRINANDVINEQLDDSHLILAKATIGDGIGSHWVPVQTIELSYDKDGKQKIEYKVISTSDRDDGRRFSSEKAGSTREAQVIELVIYKKER